MDARRWTLLLGTLLAVLAGCSSEVNALETTVQQTALDLQKDVVQFRLQGERLAQDITALYARVDSLDLSTDKLDVSQGGPFQVFQPGNYYHKPDKAGAAFYLSPLDPADEVMKKELRLMMHVEPLVTSFEINKDISYIIFYGTHSPQTLGLLFPWIDMVANFPPGLDIKNFEWYQRGLSSNGEGVWSAGPFTNLVNGWVIDVAIPTFKDGAPKGVVVLPVAIDALFSKFLAGQTKALLLLGPGTEVLGQSPGAKALTGFPELDLVNLIRQTRENTFVPDRYRLTHPDQSPEAQTLGQKIVAGESSFTLNLNGRPVAVRTAEVPEIHFQVVGLTEE